MRPWRREHLVDERGHVRLGRDVGADPALGRVEVGDDDGRPFGLEPGRDRGPDPLGAARDDRDRALERAHRSGENDVGTSIRFFWVWINGWIFPRKSFQRASAASRARRSSRSAKLSYAHMCVYVESSPTSVVNAPTKRAEDLLLDRDAFGLVQAHELGKLPRVHVVVALLDDHSRTSDAADGPVLELEPLVDPVRRALAPDSRLLHAAERRDLGRDQARC